MAAAAHRTNIQKPIVMYLNHVDVEAIETVDSHAVLQRNGQTAIIKLT